MDRSVTLDGIRGVLAIVVLFYHMTEIEELNRIMLRGYLAVDFFFLLSGFVIGWKYTDKALRKEPRIWSFFVTRFIRLYPMIIFGTLLGAIASVGQVLVSNGLELGSVLKQTMFGLVLLPIMRYTDGSGGIGFPLNGVIWSLFYEISVNMIWISIVPFLTRKIGIAIVAGGLVWICIIAAMHGNLHYGADFRYFFEGAGRVAFSFSAGVALVGLKIRLVALKAELLIPLLLLTMAVPAFAGDRFYDVICVAAWSCPNAWCRIADLRRDPSLIRWPRRAA